MGLLRWEWFMVYSGLLKRIISDDTMPLV